MKPEDDAPEFHPRPYEGADLHPGTIVRVAIIFVAGLALSLGVVLGLFHFFENVYPARTSEAAPRVSESDLPPLPRLQTTPALDLQQVRAAEDQHLSRYAWVNRQQGLAQIPIERAMNIWVQMQGAMISTNAPPATNAGTTELQMRQDKAKEANHAP